MGTPTTRRRAAQAVLSLAILAAAGCAGSYAPMPLAPESLDRALSVPADDVLRVRASALQHPLLDPIDLNLADGLNPDEAAVLAVILNPILRAERDRIGVAAAQLLQAGILPNPQITASLDQPFAGATAGTFTGWGLGLDYDLQALITRSAEIDVARAEQASVALDVAWAEWQAALDARLHAVRLIWLQREYDEASSAAGAAQQAADAVHNALRQNLITQVEADAADADLQRFRITALEAQAAIDSERLALKRSIGLPAASDLLVAGVREQGLKAGVSDEALGVRGPIPDPYPLTPVLVSERRLDLLALRRGYDSQEAKVRGAVLSRFPKISVGLAANRDTSNVISIGPSVTLDLPLFDRAQGRVAIETATRQQLFDEYASRVFEALSEIAQVRSELESVAQRIDATDSYVTRLQALQQTYADAVRRGNADILNLHQVQNTLADTKLEALRLRQERAELIVALEAAQGQVFTQSARSPQTSPPVPSTAPATVPAATPATSSP